MVRYLLVLCALSIGPSAWAGDVSISHGWIRLLPGDLPAAGYCTVANDSGQAVTIVAATAPGFAHAMLHRSVTENGMEKMLPVPRLTIPAGGLARFAPGGYHIMLMPPHDALKPGDRVQVTFEFADGTKRSAPFAVTGAAATSGD